MAIPVQCQHCGTKFRAGENLAGKRVKCSKCSNSIMVPPRQGQMAPPQAAKTKQRPPVPKQEPPEDDIENQIDSQASRALRLALWAFLWDCLFGAGIIVGIMSWRLATKTLRTIEKRKVGLEAKGKAQVARLLGLLAIGCGILPCLFLVLGVVGVVVTIIEMIVFNI